MVNVNFFGVRGSTPSPCDANQRYGGNTSCVAIEDPGHEPIVLDMGTGLRFWGTTLPQEGTFKGSALVTHFHWDHVQGLPFFTPANREGARFDIYAPADVGAGVANCFESFLRPPYFPVDLNDFVGDFRFHALADDSTAVGKAKVTSRFIPHLGPTLGFRIEIAGVTLAYIPDHQQPLDNSMSIKEAVLELCDGVDLLIHDAQYTPQEFAQKSHWGHCTVEYALHVANEAGAKRLVLFHHDPDRDDSTLDQILTQLQDAYTGNALQEIIAASEGLTISFA